MEAEPISSADNSAHIARVGNSIEDDKAFGLLCRCCRIARHGKNTLWSLRVGYLPEATFIGGEYGYAFVGEFHGKSKQVRRGRSTNHHTFGDECTCQELAAEFFAFDRKAFFFVAGVSVVQRAYVFVKIMR